MLSNIGLSGFVLLASSLGLDPIPGLVGLLVMSGLVYKSVLFGGGF